MRLISLLALSLGLFIGGNEARAYPQFQFSTGNDRCTLCHFSPVGGGLINGYGRDEAADTISNGGNGAFLNELWEPPEWLDIGGDFRGALGVHDTEAKGIDPLIFPMQADLYTRFSLSEKITLNTTIGLRGSARPRDPPPISRVGSREHYLMYKGEGKYVRAGRFYAPYGLRQVDHTNYIRRDLGYYAWEETYGLSGGYNKNPKWEVHASVFMRDPLLIKVGRQGLGAAVMYERRFSEETAAWGLQSKVQLGPNSKRYWGGATLKYWFESLELLVLSEVDLGVVQNESDGAGTAFGGIAHLNLSKNIAGGLMLGTTLEAKQNDFRQRGQDSEAASITLQYFPRAHYEVMLIGKAERTKGSYDLLSLLMLHYYL